MSHLDQHACITSDAECRYPDVLLCNVVERRDGAVYNLERIGSGSVGGARTGALALQFDEALVRVRHLSKMFQNRARQGVQQQRYESSRGK